VKREVLESARKIVRVFVVALLAGGCSDDVNIPGNTAVPVAELPAYDVVIARVVRDPDNRTISTQLTAGSAERQINITPFSTVDLPVGFAADLSGPDEILYHVSLAWDPEDPANFRLMERSGEDFLTLSAGRSDDRLFEEYVINGDRFRADYPDLDRETRRRIMTHSGDGRLSCDPAIVEFAGKYAEFKNFYGRFSDTSLNHNPDGALLVALLTDDQYVAAAVGARDNGDPGKMADKTADRICATATICGAFKCGTLVNPLCVPCAGTSLACAIAEVVCWIFDCGWD
jgi:hypothetical protein